MAEVVVKHAGGRPTKYDEKYNEQAYKYCLLGADDKRLAELFDISESTVNLWKLEHPEFSESIKKGKVIADAEIANSLYQKAKGFEHEDVQVFQFQGEPVIVPITKYYPPDTGAAMAWLKNRQPDKWRDTQNIEVSGANGGPLLTQNIVALADSDLKQLLEIMERSQIQGEIVDIESSE